ncbi:MAG: OadG family protein [Melioribacteraceae bacterium]|nr:OadG family protein [Melioribacteraceae bacterium]
MTKIKMKRVLLILMLPILMVLVSSCDIAEKKTKIEFGLKVGETYSIQISNLIKSNEELDNIIIKKDERVLAGFSFTPTSISPDGEIHLKGSINFIEVMKEGPLGQIAYNSMVDTSDIPIMAKPYYNILNKEFSLKILKDGTVNAVYGMDSILVHSMDDFEIEEPQLIAYLEESLENQFSNEVLFEQFERMFAVFPTKPVGVNDTWNKSVKLSAKTPLLIDNEYRLLERNNGVAIIAVNSRIASDKDRIKTNPRRFVDQDLVGTQMGKVQIDEITGWIGRAKFEYKIHSTRNNTPSKQNAGKPLLVLSEIEIKYEPFASSAFRDIAFTPDAVLKGDGIGMTLTGMGVVFSSLILLYILFSNMRRVINFRFRFGKKENQADSDSAKAKQLEKEEAMTGEINAAIAAALFFLSQEMHDTENTVLTIKRASKTYSPWSSKLYGIRQNPR